VAVKTIFFLLNDLKTEGCLTSLCGKAM